MKAKLLAQYACREPKPFAQLDWWLEGDDTVGRDKEGHGGTFGGTVDLMNGSDLRILIPEVRDPKQAAELAKMLRKAAAYVEKNTDSLQGFLADGRRWMLRNDSVEGVLEDALKIVRQKGRHDPDFPF